MTFLEIEMHESRSASYIGKIGSYRRGTVDVFEDKTTAWKVNTTTKKLPSNIFRGIQVRTNVR